MRAAVSTAVGRSETRVVPDPACPQDGLLLQVDACGICGTDVRTYWNGDHKVTYPWILGHEIAGTVAEVGPDAACEWKPGDRIVAISTLACRACATCRRGLEHLCERKMLLGYDWPGAFAELNAVPAEALPNTFRVPDGLDAAFATMADPFSDAINGHKDLDVRLDSDCVVVGAGPIGTFHAALLREQGAARVTLLEVNATRLELARSVLGDDRLVYLPTGGDAADVVLAAARGGDYAADRVIVACSAPDAQRAAVALGARGGRVVFFGGLPKGTTHAEFPSNVLHYREVTVLGSYASGWAEQRLALDMIAADRCNVQAAVTSRVGLDGVHAAMEAIRAGTELKVVIEPAR